MAPARFSDCSDQRAAQNVQFVQSELAAKFSLLDAGPKVEVDAINTPARKAGTFQGGP